MVSKVEVESKSDEMENSMDDAGLTGDALAKNLAANGGIPKNFRQQADMEAFYRFVHENDLREEALTILDEVRAGKAAIKAAKNRIKH